MGCTSSMNSEENQKEDYLTRTILESIQARKRAKILEADEAELEEEKLRQKELLLQQHLLDSIDAKGPKSYIENLILEEIPKMKFAPVASEEEIVKDLNERECEEYKEGEYIEDEEKNEESLEKEQEQNKNDIEELKRQIEELNKNENDSKNQKQRKSTFFNKEQKVEKNSGKESEEKDIKEEVKKEEEEKEEEGGKEGNDINKENMNEEEKKSELEEKNEEEISSDIVNISDQKYKLKQQLQKNVLKDEKLKELMKLKAQKPSYAEKLKKFKYPKKEEIKEENKLEFPTEPSELTLCVIGEKKSGKTSFIKKYIRNTFEEAYRKTEKIDKYDEMEVEYDSKKIKLHILDTPPLNIKKNIELIQKEGINKSQIILYIIDVNDEYAEFKVRLMSDSFEFHNKQIIVILANKSDTNSFFSKKNAIKIESICILKGYLFYLISCANTFKNEIENYVKDKIIKEYLSINK